MSGGKVVGAPTFSALRNFHTTVAAMLANPDCHSDLLVVGIYLARRCDRHDVY